MKKIYSAIESLEILINQSFPIREQLCVIRQDEFLSKLKKIEYYPNFQEMFHESRGLEY